MTCLISKTTRLNELLQFPILSQYQLINPQPSKTTQIRQQNEKTKTKKKIEKFIEPSICLKVEIENEEKKKIFFCFFEEQKILSAKLNDC